MTALPVGTHPCKCARRRHAARFVVLTGGPGGGKTAVLEMARRYLCRHVVILPEAASIVFRGGFPRLDSDSGQKAAQRAIFLIQRELERLAAADKDGAVVLCDRGTLDGLAYWPGAPRSFFSENGTTLQQELDRYAAVIHIETPSAAALYHNSDVRIEPVKTAQAIRFAASPGSGAGIRTASWSAPKRTF